MLAGISIGGFQDVITSAYLSSSFVDILPFAVDFAVKLRRQEEAVETSQRVMRLPPSLYKAYRPLIGAWPWLDMIAGCEQEVRDCRDGAGERAVSRIYMRSLEVQKIGGDSSTSGKHSLFVENCLFTGRARLGLC